MKGKNPPNSSLKATKVKRLSSRQTKVHDGILDASVKEVPRQFSRQECNCSD